MMQPDSVYELGCALRPQSHLNEASLWVLQGFQSRPKSNYAQLYAETSHKVLLQFSLLQTLYYNLIS